MQPSSGTTQRMFAQGKLLPDVTTWRHIPGRCVANATPSPCICRIVSSVAEAQDPVGLSTEDTPEHVAVATLQIRSA